MAQANPPQNIQVLDPPQQQQAPAQDHVDAGPAEDRILSPDETINFFRTGSIEEPDDSQSDETTTPEQAQMADEFFQTVQGEPNARGAKHTPPPGPNLPPGTPDPNLVQQAAQQDQQQQNVAPQQVQQVQPQQVQGQQPQQVQVQQQQQPLPTPQEAALQAQVQSLTNQIQGLTAAMAQQQQQTQQTQQPNQQQGQQPQFNFQVPSQYAEAIASEDPNLRNQALNQLLNGVAETVHRQTLQEVDTRINQITPVVQQQVQQAQSQAEIKRDMYGTYPELSGMQDMVVAAATQLQNQYPGGWSPDYRDAIAERLAPLVQGLSQKVSGQRAARGQVVQQPQQFLPQGQPQGQVQGQLPPGVVPTQVQGGVHVNQAAPQQGQPVLVRDAAGNYSQVYSNQQHAVGPQARPGVQNQVDPGLQDIWSTFGY